jgi:hypothetical protein
MRSSSEFDVQEKALLEFINLYNLFTSPKLFSYRTIFFFFFFFFVMNKSTKPQIIALPMLLARIYLELSLSDHSFENHKLLLFQKL